MNLEMCDMIATKLLWPCWMGLPAAYKVRYARNIWQQFEDQIRSAAYTSSLAKFFDTLTGRLAIVVLSKDVRLVTEVLTDPNPHMILRTLRQETTALVLMCRLKNEERKEQIKKERQDADLRVSGDHDGADIDQP